MLCVSLVAGFCYNIRVLSYSRADIPHLLYKHIFSAVPCCAEGAEVPKLAALAQELPESNAGPACALIPAVHSDGTTARGLHEDGTLVEDHEYFDNFFLRYNKVCFALVCVHLRVPRGEYVSCLSTSH